MVLTSKKNALMIFQSASSYVHMYNIRHLTNVIYK